MKTRWKAKRLWRLWLFCNAACACLAVAQAQTQTLPNLQAPQAPAFKLPEFSPPPSGVSRSAAEYREGAFEAAQWEFRSEASVALQALAARFAQGTDRIAELERHIEDLKEDQRSKTAALILGLLDKRSVDRESQAGVPSDVAALQVQLDEVSATLKREHPDYWNLTRPRIFRADEIQNLLRPDEALLVVLPEKNASYIFALTHDRFEWYRSATLPAGAIQHDVDDLRALVDPPGGHQAASSSQSDESKISQALYDGLVAPAEPIVEQKRVLFVVTSGPLGSLPIGILQMPDSNGARSARWLADEHIISVLPAVSSLVDLRCRIRTHGSASSDCRALLNEKTQMQKDTPAADPDTSAAHIILAAAGAPTLLGDKAVIRGGALKCNAEPDRLADSECLRHFEPLQGALEELDKYKQLYGDQAEVLRGDDATERAVRASKAMQQAPYVVFSTHSLLANEANVGGEPGLVFTPPKAEDRGEADDGFLSAAEIARMHFRARLLVLSACNTASPTGGSTEGLSGLARAFFYAGAQTLVVSNWKVDDKATYELMSRIFQALKSGKVTPGEAMQNAMREVRAMPQFRDPRYWGAFSLIGEPR